MLHFLALKWLVRTLKDVINIVFQLVNSFLEKRLKKECRQYTVSLLIYTYGKATLKELQVGYLNGDTQEKK